MPSERNYEQAKELMRTIRLLKNQFIKRHFTSNLPDNIHQRASELTMPQMDMLAEVREAGEISIKELAQRLHVSAPSASTMVDRLVDMGGLTREQSQRDRREVVVRLSDAGEKAAELVEGQMLEALCDLLDRVGPEFAEKWVDVYARLREVVEADMEARAQATKGSTVSS